MIAAALLAREQDRLQLDAQRRAARARLSDLIGRSLRDDELLGVHDDSAIVASAIRALDTLRARPEFAEFAASTPGFRFVPAVEDEAGAQATGGFHGRADNAVRSLFEGGLAGHEVYCCGAPAMVTAVRKACVEELGLDAHRFFSDVFVPGPAA